MTTGRTHTKWIRFGVEDNGSAPREIPIDSIGAVGFKYDSVDLTAWQDAIKGYLAGHPDAIIEITGPSSTTAAVAFAASAAAPALSGSHTVLAPLSALTWTTPLGLAVMFGQQGYWTTGDPVFGIVTSSATNGYLLYEYTLSGNKYKASFRPIPGATPAWGTAILA